MALPAVGQAEFLAHSLAELVHSLQPRSVAVLGCAGGNGFAGLPPGQVERVVGVDLNPGYIAAARQRYAGRFDQLELHCQDVLAEVCAFEPVDLVFAGLLFEYVDVAACLAKIKRLLRPGGHLGVILQLPSDSIPEVTPSPFTSLGRLAGIMALVPPDQLASQAKKLGFSVHGRVETRLASGKGFQAWVFQAPANTPGAPPIR